MAKENPIWQLIQRIESSFAKDDIKSASRETLEQVLINTYSDLCALADSSADWWERDSQALAEIRSKTIGA